MTELGIYLHVPFCTMRCDYCAFVTYTGLDELHQRYVDAACAQLRADQARVGRAATSLYLGGGTPSKLTPTQVAQLVEAATLVEGAEVSMECNPEDVTVERLEGYVSAGVTRCSFGIQSTAPHVLKSLGRRHGTGALSDVAHAAAQVGLTSWSIDLIYGAVGERPEDFDRCLDEVLSLELPPPHLSAYALTVEPGTPLAKTVALHPDDDVQADRYEVLTRRLTDADYEFEEISNWSKPGHHCRHHRTYWSGGDYLGIGAGAHGHLDGHRFWNLADPQGYITAIERGSSPIEGEEHLDPATRRFELASLMLRTSMGIPPSWLDADPVLDGLLEHHGERVLLSPRGRMLANVVAQHLVV